MQRLNAYSLALIECESHFSCVKAAGSFDGLSHDWLTRSLKRGGFQGLSDWSLLPPSGVLIVDDTAIEKPYSQKIEGVDYIYSSSQHKSLPGLSCQLVLWRVGTQVFVLDVVMCEKGGPNKNELFRQTLFRLFELGLKPEYVTFDTWYAANETLNLLNELGWTYVCKIRTNRIFNGRRMNIHKFYGAKGRKGQLRGGNHLVQVAKHGHSYFATNRIDPVNTRCLWQAYRKRWIIETVFRDLKDVLHLQSCRARTLQAQFNHVLACLEAYLFLKQSFPAYSIQSAQQQFLQLQPDQKFKQTAFLPYAA